MARVQYEPVICSLSITEISKFLKTENIPTVNLSLGYFVYFTSTIIKLSFRADVHQTKVS